MEQGNNSLSESVDMLTIACLARQIHGGPFRLGTRCNTLGCYQTLVRCMDCRCLLETHIEACFHRPNRGTMAVPDPFLDPYCISCTHRYHDTQHALRTERLRSRGVIPDVLHIHMEDDDNDNTHWASLDSVRNASHEQASLVSEVVIPPSIWTPWVTAPLLGSNAVVEPVVSIPLSNDIADTHRDDIWEDG